MTENEIKFLVSQWGPQLANEILTDVGRNISRMPTDSIVLAVAVKHLNRRIDDLIATIRTMQSSQYVSGFGTVQGPETPQELAQKPPFTP